MVNTSELVPAEIVPIGGRLAERILGYGIASPLLRAIKKDRKEVVFVVTKDEEQIGRVLQELLVPQLDDEDEILGPNTICSRATQTFLTFTEKGLLRTGQPCSPDTPNPARFVALDRATSEGINDVLQLGHSIILGAGLEDRAVVLTLERAFAQQNQIAALVSSLWIPTCWVRGSEACNPDDICPMNTNRRRKWVSAQAEGETVWLQTYSCCKCG